MFIRSHFIAIYTVLLKKSDIILFLKLLLIALLLKISNFSRGKGVLRLTLCDGENPDAGTLALVFSDKPLVLHKWAVTDPQGTVTTVALLDARFGMELDPQLFVFDDPKKLYLPFEN